MSQYTSETVHHSILWRRSYQPTKYFFFHPSIFTIWIYTAESSKVFVVEQLCLGSASITQFLMRTGLNMLFCNKKCTMVQINLQPNYSTAIVYLPYFFSVETSIQEGTSIHQNMYMWRSKTLVHTQSTNIVLHLSIQYSIEENLIDWAKSIPSSSICLLFDLMQTQIL